MKRHVLPLAAEEELEPSRAVKSANAATSELDRRIESMTCRSLAPSIVLGGGEINICVRSVGRQCEDGTNYQQQQQQQHAVGLDSGAILLSP